MKCLEAQQRWLASAMSAEQPFEKDLENHFGTCETCLEWMDLQAKDLLGPTESMDEISAVRMRRDVLATLKENPRKAGAGFSWNRLASLAALLVLALGLMVVTHLQPEIPGLEPASDETSLVAVELWSGEAVVDMWESGFALDDDGLDSLMDLAEYHPQWIEQSDSLDGLDEDDDWPLGEDPLFDDYL